MSQKTPRFINSPTQVLHVSLWLLPARRISAFMNIEAWRKNENSGSFDQLTKGTLLTVEGYFKPEEWTDKDGVQHNRIVTVAVKFYPAVEKEEEVPSKPAKEAKKGKK